MEPNGINEKIIWATENVFQNMAHMKVTGNPTSQKANFADKHLTAMVGIAGSYVGLASISCTEIFAKQVAAAMLGIEIVKLTDEDVRDAVGEIANMVGGQLKAKFSETLEKDVEVFRMTVPSVISGDDFQTHAITDAPRYPVVFDCALGQFFVELALKKA